MSTYPYVQAKWYTAGAILQYRAIVIHHAEGGGTVGYLAKVTRDVSASHVIEYSGRIVQMVKDGDASHCQHVSPEPYTTAAYGIYSSQTGRIVLLEGWSNVNRYVFAVEMEGFRSAGPNPAQAASLKALVADLRARFPSIRGLLGHRDIQDKPCPGGLIPWASIGGHGLFTEEADMDDRIIPEGRCTVKAGDVFRDAGLTAKLSTFAADVPGVQLYGRAILPTIAAVRVDLASGDAQDIHVGYVPLSRIVVAAVDCTAPIAAAVKPLNDRIADIKAKVAAA